MKIVDIFAEDWVSLDKIQYVIDNVNIHPFCLSFIQFKITSSKDDAHLIYTDADINLGSSLFMVAQKKLMLPEVKVATFYLKTYEHRATKLHFINSSLSSNVNLLENNIIKADIFETLFFHWSRYEEITWPKEKRDHWDLMPESELFVVKNNLNHYPFVDDLILWFIQLFVPNYQAECKFRILNTYDIDYIHFQELSLLGNIGNLMSILKRGSHPFTGIRNYVKSWMSKKVDLTHIDWSDHTAVLFFLISGNHKFDFRKNERCLERIKYMVDYANVNDLEVGIHPSFETAYSIEMMQSEIRMLENITQKEITKSRQHFLHMDYEITIPILEQCNIKEDFSCGFNLHVGYKAGTSYAFSYFNWKEFRKSTVLCRPMIWMDSAQWFLSQKQLSKYLVDEKMFNSKHTIGEIYTNKHPIFQQKLNYF